MTDAMTVAALPVLDAPAQPPTRRGVNQVALMVGSITVALFVVGQYRSARSFGDHVGDPRAVRFQVAFFIVPYLLIIGVAVLAALAGHRRLAVLPPFAYAGLGWVMSSSTVSAGVLGSWSAATTSARWLGFSVALVPCVAAALLTRRHAPPVSPSMAGGGVSLAFVGGVIVLAIVMRAVVNGVAWDTYADLIAVAVIAGLAVSSRLILLPAALATGACLSPEVLSWAAAGASGTPPSRDLFFFVVLVLAGAAHRPVAVLADGLRERPIRLFVAVNVLNAADAVATFVAVRAGNAAEANPVIDIIGLPAKVGIGLLASHLIARHRPGALLIPLVVLAVVFAWHAVGFLII